jgi:hypothetical protein
VVETSDIAGSFVDRIEEVVSDSAALHELERQVAAARGFLPGEREFIIERIGTYLADNRRELEARRCGEIGDDWMMYGIDPGPDG